MLLHPCIMQFILSRVLVCRIESNVVISVQTEGHVLERLTRDRVHRLPEGNAPLGKRREGFLDSLRKIDLAVQIHVVRDPTVVGWHQPQGLLALLDLIRKFLLLDLESVWGTRVGQDLEVRISLRLSVAASDDDNRNIISFIRVIGGVNHWHSITVECGKCLVIVSERTRRASRDMVESAPCSSMS